VSFVFGEASFESRESFGAAPGFGSGMRSVISTAITRIDYNQLTGDLDVTFVSGSTYRYYGVQRGIYQRFMRAPSIGAFFVRHIRDHYPYRERRTARTAS
jgi:hypothetical protein